MDRKEILLTIFGGLVTILVAWLGYLGLTRSKRRESETSFQAELVKEWSKLTATLSSLNADITKLHADLLNERISKTDFQIRLEKSNARIQNFVELIQRMLKVKECWKHGDEGEARRLLALVERDRKESEGK